MFRPEGVYAAMLTPFGEDGRIEEEVLRRLVDFSIEKGLHGLFPVSSVGEGVHLDFAEKCRCMDVVQEQAAGRVPVTPGVVATHPAECVRLAAHAAAIGCAAIVVTPPYFYRPGPGMVERFFERVVDEVDLPVILYNIPLFTQPLDSAVVGRLARHPRVVGMKDSSGSMVDFLQFLDRTTSAAGGEPHLNLLTGREETLLPTLVMGGRGCMTALSGILPEVMVGIYERFRAGDLAGARELQLSVLAFTRALFAAPFPLGFKAALELRGFPMGPPRLPLSDADAAELAGVKAELDRLMPPLLEQLDAR